MTTYKNRLPPSVLMGYISPAPHKTGAGHATPLLTLAHNRASGFFYVRRTATFSHYGGAYRAAFGRAGF
ncbi:hypothetical protein F8762_08000 [Salmonella enterica]|nr:hypothetical protein CGA23_09865 [Salmonella enterica subsp. enterica]EAA2695965.1 hypothetical protein [Salmonella enterica]ECH8181597.1 hypothetical protein [Salmonella enterica subsp. enterica serovar Rissen]ECL7193730.1 hypothetical protein [Salmonella enterica subsp. enterica serovar Muenchen]EEJ6874562.1 hypothetical protein [Salmonella enterica subsp. houtenae]